MQRPPRENSQSQESEKTYTPPATRSTAARNSAFDSPWKYLSVKAKNWFLPILTLFIVLFVTRNYTEIVSWLEEVKEWEIASPSQLHFRRGLGLANLPLVVDPVNEDKHLIPTALVAIGWLEMICIWLMCISCAVWMRINRKTKVVVNAQGNLLILVLVGCIIASLSIIGLLAEDQSGSLVQPDFGCMFAPVMFAAASRHRKPASLPNNSKTYRFLPF